MRILIYLSGASCVPLVETMVKYALPECWTTVFGFEVWVFVDDTEEPMDIKKVAEAVRPRLAVLDTITAGIIPELQEVDPKIGFLVGDVKDGPCTNHGSPLKKLIESTGQSELLDINSWCLEYVESRIMHILQKQSPK